MLMLPAFRSDPRIRLVAACAPREASRRAFQAEFGGRVYENVEGLCADPEVEVVYIATPHQMHADHAVAVAAAGKHILLDKPLAVEMADGRRIVEAAEKAGVDVIVGPSHSFDRPVQQAGELIRSGELGRIRMIQAFNYTDFLYRPRRPEELRTSEGGGVIFSQGVHQIDVVRFLAGGVGTRLAAMTGAWDPDRPTEGAYSALMSFQNGCFATFTYSGYAHFDSDIWMDGIGELGQRKSPQGYGAARRTLATVLDAQQEAALKTTRTYGAGDAPKPADQYEHFGPIVVLCDRGDIRLVPSGLHVYGDFEQKFVPAPTFETARTEVIDALVQTVRHGHPAVQSARWGLASLEACHAIIRSAETGTFVDLVEQVPV
ncbi:Gfo/Idh/MocA family oxidoreductase [Pelagibacterium nitratireducens]|uniref:Gfo/Idh/MocA family oxidoreductase n=3 Tax=Devosiaceae TaxID=2831106 RepID=A0ABZ2I316_9HYPH|nr:Gfo/Idh/MocA family oxidoreductase [Devosia salina]